MKTSKPTIPALFKKLSASFALLFMLFLISIIACNQDTNPEDTSNTNDETTEMNTSPKAVFANLKVDPPVAKIDQSGQSLIVNNVEKAKTFKINSGTNISIPENAFVDKDGKAIKGEVELSYREFRSAPDIIASGIPMRVVDENGHDEWMQTAGMFEINGTQKGEEVFIAEDKLVEVSFASDVEGEYYAWFFEEETGIWNKIGATDSSVPISTEFTKEEKAEIQELRSKTSRKPSKPDLSDSKNRLEFTDLDVSAISELDGKNSVILIYAGDPTDKDAPDNNDWISSPGQWLKKELKPLDKPRHYQLTMYGDKKYSIPVRLPLQEAEIQKAMANYEQELKRYKRNVALLSDKKKIMEQRQQFARTLKVSNFGFYNHDIFYGKNDIINLAADFRFDEEYDDVMDDTNVFLITGENRVVVSFTKSQWDNFRFSESDNNTLVAILPDNTAAYYPSSKFEKEKESMKNADGNEFVFNMESTGHSIDSPEDIADLLSEAIEVKPLVNQNYPNPASSMTTIEYDLPIDAKQVELILTSMEGKAVVSKKLGALSAGEYKEELDVSSFQNGLYVYSFLIDGERISKKMNITH